MALGLPVNVLFSPSAWELMQTTCKFNQAAQFVLEAKLVHKAVLAFSVEKKSVSPG